MRERLEGRPEGEDMGRVLRAVQEAMAEIRSLSRGLQLPDIAERPLLDIVGSVVQAHEARTGDAIALRADCAGEPPLGPGVKVCIYRFLHEGLANVSRHGQGRGIEVELAGATAELRLVVRDRGPGMPCRPRDGALGLAGLRDRVESLGGTFTAGTRPSGGTEIAMTLEIGGQA